MGSSLVPRDVGAGDVRDSLGMLKHDVSFRCATVARHAAACHSDLKHAPYCHALRP